MNQTTQPKPDPKATFKGCLILIGIVFIIGIIFKVGCSSSEPKYTKEQQDSIFGEKNKGMAYIMSQDFVKERLKSPASAEFPYGNHATYIVIVFLLLILTLTVKTHLALC